MDKEQNELKKEQPSVPEDPSVWNPTASFIRNVDLELVFYGHEQCTPRKHVGPATKGHYKIHYVYRGTGKICIDDKTFHVRAGQCFVFYPDDYVYYEADAQDPWAYFWVAFDGANAEYYLRRANVGKGHILVEHCDRDALNDAFDRLMRVDLMDPTKDMKFISLLYLILSAIQTDPRAEDSLRNMRYPSIYVKTAIKYIQENYAKGISVTEVAAHLSLDRKYFSRIFKDHLKVSPNYYIASYRLMKACELLENTQMSILEISDAVGYENPFSFSRAFKRGKGISPSMYREQYRAEQNADHKD